jgi:hypothetical protein
MAKSKDNTKKIIAIKKTTSIGRSALSRPKNKHARRSFKKYRGQGK